MSCSEYSSEIIHSLLLCSLIMSYLIFIPSHTWDEVLLDEVGLLGGPYDPFSLGVVLGWVKRFSGLLFSSKYLISVSWCLSIILFLPPIILEDIPKLPSILVLSCLAGHSSEEVPILPTTLWFFLFYYFHKGGTLFAFYSLFLPLLSVFDRFHGWPSYSSVHQLFILSL